jgi:hypothetical protein
VALVEAVSSGTFAVTLDRPIEPGAWTYLTLAETEAATRLGALPGDVNGNGLANATDVLVLIDALNKVGAPRPIWSVDLDRSGAATATDVLTVIDLLNGAGAFEPWNNVALP